MSGHHHHGHHHGHEANKKTLAVSFCLIAAFMLVEIIGGWLTGSLALLSDAGHMLSDALAIGFSLWAFKLGERAVSRSRTFGYQRAEILFALFNGLTLAAIAVWIIIEAAARFRHPPEIATGGMLAVSITGLLVNIVVARYMHRHSDVEDNINMKSAYLHVLGDLLGSVGAIAAALLMMAFGWRLADPLISVLIALLIAHSGIGIIKNTTHILMQGAPQDIDQEDLVARMKAVDGVENVHDLHLWTLTSSRHLLSAHIVVDGNMSVREAQSVLEAVAETVRSRGIGHVTLQIESREHGHSETLYCDEGLGHEHRHHDRHHDHHHPHQH
ncbi:cation diffusion facilitator family transporter [Bergeriella denitrificans]|uniref:Cation-efflux system n=1 Tax=Bergeriella denitrificans TaxID=494 RepID=A0A378UI30_BERDE|nr:cation diffusion facilitator family transporter [Bergeriella denitrificans]STZ76132.1 cation-efflux system [Bergeriella denitrificans]